MDILIPGTEEKNRVWDEFVPIVTKGRDLHIYLLDNIEAPSNYAEMCDVLNAAYKGDTIHVYINNGGGYVDSGFMIIDAMRKSKATIVGHLSGTVASVSTFLALACDKLVIADYTQFMIHNYSGGSHGKGHEMKAALAFTDNELNKAFTKEYDGFLTPEEMQLTIDGKDYWMSKEEVEGRLDARKKKDRELLEEISKKYKH